MAGNRTIKAVGPSYMLPDRKSAVQRAVNLYLRQVEGLGEDVQLVLDSAPGLQTFITFPQDIRGVYTTEDRRFVVYGNTLAEFFTDGTYATRGTLLTASGYVGMKHGTGQLVVVDGTNGYVLTLSSNAFGRITSGTWRGSDWVEELDGYFIFIAPGTDQFYLSAIDDATTLDALDFSSADASPDKLVTHRVIRRELILAGQRSMEVWIDTGDADFPLVRYNSTPIDIGVVGVRAITRTTDSLVWIGNTERGRGYVYMLQGHQPIRVSTQAVETALAGSSDISAALMWSYHVEGNEFVGIKAPGLPTTWVFDMSTRQWHERAEFVAGEWENSRINLIAFLDGVHYAAGGAVLYKMSTDYHTLAGDMLVRERTWPHLMQPSMEPVSYRGVEVQCTTGEGGSITLETSNDGGYTFNAPQQRSLGVTGRWMQRVRWLWQGTARDRVFRLRCSDAVPLTIHSATVDA